jgi:spore germination protein GerM
MATKPKTAKNSKNSRTSKKRRKPPVGCLVWLTLLLIVSVALFAARASIARAVESSGIAELVGLPRREDSLSPSAGSSPEGSAPAANPKTAREQPPPESSPVPEAPAQKPPSPPATGTPRATPRATAKPSIAQPARTPEPSATPSLPQPVRPATQKRMSTLYFVKVTDEGAIAVSGLPRSVTFTDAPLTQTLEALVSGPTAAESRRGFRSLIPAGTRIEIVRTEGRTAYVSFNESFRFNSYGNEGLVAQLRQVVYTATEFSNVSRVQVLIAGRVTDYLGPEGIRIRDPLSRESFTDGRL